MAFGPFGGAEAGAAGGSGGGVYLGISANDSIVASPGAFPGAYSYSADPVNGVPVLENYGFQAYLPDAPRFLTVPFMFRFTDTGGDFDEVVSVAELGGTTAGGAFARRVSLGTSEPLQIFDKDEDEIGTTPNGYCLKDTDYWMLWYVDLREDANSRDILWVYRPAVSFVSGGVTFADANPDTMTMAVNEGQKFIPGDVITVAGSASNDGSYTIAGRVAGVLTLDAGDALTNEGPVGATLSTPAGWDKAIDVTGHGDGGLSANPIDAITFGTSYGKSLPTQGGPCYYDEMVVHILNRSPNTTPIGSVTTVFKVPSGAGSDNDFDSGAPSFLDVDEIPPDQVALDQGDANGEQQSYAINDANGGDTPLAIQVIGSGQRSGGGSGIIKTYLLESSTYDYADQWNQLAGYRVLRPGGALAKTYNEVNGNPITESLFNTLEAGIEVVTLTGGQTIDLDQIGLEYMIEGPQSLPADFPTTAEMTITGKAAGAAVGSANPVIW